MKIKRPSGDNIFVTGRTFLYVLAVVCPLWETSGLCRTMDKEEELQRIWREWLQQYDLTETMVLKGEIWKRELHCTCCKLAEGSTDIPSKRLRGFIAGLIITIIILVVILGAILGST